MHGRERVAVIPSPTDVGQNEARLRVSGGEAREVRAIARVLTGPVTASMLPDVVQNGKAALRGPFGDRIEEHIIGAPSGGQLHADGASSDTAVDLGERERRVVRVDRHVPTHSVGIPLGDGLHRVVATRRIGRRREVRRGEPTPRAKNGCDVNRDPDALARSEPRLVQGVPFRAAAAFEEEMRVDVDERSGTRQRRG